MRERVAAARARQARRYAGLPFALNAELPNAALAAHCALDPAARGLFERSVSLLGLTMRAFVRSLRVARTLADLDGAESLSGAHAAEALGYRALDRGL